MRTLSSSIPPLILLALASCGRHTTTGDSASTSDTPPTSTAGRSKPSVSVSSAASPASDDSPAWAALVRNVEIGHRQRYDDLDAWCEANLASRYPELKPCNSFNTWFWCPTSAGEGCQPPGDNPLEQRDNERFRAELKAAFLKAPAMAETVWSAGSGALTADDYNLSRKSFRFYVRSARTFAALGGTSSPFTSTRKVQTIFGERRRSVSGSVYEEAPITFEISMEEPAARDFYALALPGGCQAGDCPVDNVAVDLVFRLQNYRQVGQDCVGGSCESRLAYVYELLGFRMRVADTIENKSGKSTSFSPNEILVETIYRKAL